MAVPFGKLCGGDGLGLFHLKNQGGGGKQPLNLSWGRGFLTQKFPETSKRPLGEGVGEKKCKEGLF